MPLDGGHQYVQSDAGRRRVTRVRRRSSLDYETFNTQELAGQKSVGVWNYSRHQDLDVLMVAYRSIKTGDLVHVDLTRKVVPAELEDILLDADCEKWAFNAAFERLITKFGLGIDTPYEGWRCTMALASMQSFTGTLFDVGSAMGLDASILKSTTGTKLIKLFCVPQRITKANPHARRTQDTDPLEWEEFCEYNTRDVTAEEGIRDRLLKFEVPEDEWKLYEIDQRINDNGLPVNRNFVEQAMVKSELRKAELVFNMVEVTGLDKPTSVPKLLPWLQERGYPFTDLQKATVTKVLAADKETGILTAEARHALRLRRFASQTSVRKYPAILRRLDMSDSHLRHAFQYGGAARTLRWAGRGPQPHNLTRTPKSFEPEDGGDWGKLELAANMIEHSSYPDLSLFMSEPMIALAGSVRSSFQAHEGKILRVCDLKAIESAVVAWLSHCERMLNVFASNRDPYKDFGVELYKKLYDEITGSERTICKPAVLGCAYQLGGGTMKAGKRTGLWGYAENMGVNITEAEAAAHVALFRKIYHEIPTFWAALDEAAKSALRGKPKTVGGNLRFEKIGPYLTIRLPSGRKMYYYMPRIVTRVFQGKLDEATGKYETFSRRVLSYMGKQQNGRKWVRVFTSGGKLCENVVQATARDILGIGIIRAYEDGFNLVGSVHDEIITHQNKGDNYYTGDRLRELMTAPIEWAKGLPLGASGYEHVIYRKD